MSVLNAYTESDERSAPASFATVSPKSIWKSLFAGSAKATVTEFLELVPGASERLDMLFEDEATIM